MPLGCVIFLTQLLNRRANLPVHHRLCRPSAGLVSIHAGYRMYEDVAPTELIGS